MISDLQRCESEFNSKVMGASTPNRVKEYALWWKSMEKLNAKFIELVTVVDEADDVHDEFDLLEALPFNRTGHALGFDRENDPLLHPDKLQALKPLAEVDSPAKWGSSIRSRFSHVKNLLQKIRSSHSESASVMEHKIPSKTPNSKTLN